MAVVKSTSVELGTDAHAFNLRIANPQIDSIGGDARSLADYSDASLLVLVFTCNHCPFAVHVEDALNAIAHDYRNNGLQVVAINSNYAVSHPADSFENMRIRATQKGFTFPYLHDESQEVAKAYGAVCTPDTFVYDAARKLRYRGQIDATRPGGDSATGKDLRNAIDALLRGELPEEPQYPSVGCSIKWIR